MDIQTFTRIINDKAFTDFKKMQYKYGKDFSKCLDILKQYYYNQLPILDFNGNDIVYLKKYIDTDLKIIRILSKMTSSSYGLKAAENEIVSSHGIENIHFERDSIHRILKGFAPKDEVENRILGQKKGLEFIADTNNKITEENLYQLYQMTIGNYLDEENKLLPNRYYRHDAVYIVGSKNGDLGIHHKKLPEYMKKFIEFINEEDDVNDLLKGAMIHFYLAYLHPYFDGNGRMARLLHLWFFIQKGYPATLFIPFSSLIERSKNQYYKMFDTIKENQTYSNILDLTPFLKYFTDYIYNEIPRQISDHEKYTKALKEGIITEKETKLWAFVQANYGFDEFSTKQLEKEYGDVAYATVRAFVLKFEDLELLNSRKFSNRVKYSIKK